MKPGYYKFKMDMKPKLVYLIGPKAQLTVFYKLDVTRFTKYSSPVVELDSAGNLAGSGIGALKDPKAVLTNQFQIDMTWKF